MDRIAHHLFALLGKAVAGLLVAAIVVYLGVLVLVALFALLGVVLRFVAGLLAVLLLAGLVFLALRAIFAAAMGGGRGKG